MGERRAAAAAAAAAEQAEQDATRDRVSFLEINNNRTAQHR